MGEKNKNSLRRLAEEVQHSDAGMDGHIRFAEKVRRTTIIPRVATSMWVGVPLLTDNEEEGLWIGVRDVFTSRLQKEPRSDGRKI